MFTEFAFLFCQSSIYIIQCYWIQAIQYNFYGKLQQNCFSLELYFMCNLQKDIYTFTYFYCQQYCRCLQTYWAPAQTVIIETWRQRCPAYGQVYICVLAFMWYTM